MTRFEQTEPEQIVERFHREEAILSKVLRFVDELGARIDETDLSGTAVEKFVLLFHFVKALKTCRAIERLFFGGFDEDAQALLRIVVEQAIVTRWIHKEDSNSRARSYAYYAGERQYVHLKEARKVMPDLELPPDVVKRIETAHENYNKLDKADRWLKRTHDISKLAASVNMGGSYPAHLIGSDFIHSNPTREGDYVEVGEHMFFNTVPCMPKSGLTAVMAAHHLLLIADVIDDVFELDASERLRTLITEVSKSK